MRLNVQTDYALRLLTFAAAAGQGQVTAREAAERFGISTNHMVKVAQRLTKQGFLKASRGRNGGLRLASPLNEIVIGKVVRAIEPDFALVECMQEADSSCLVHSCCRLKSILIESTAAFLANLDRYTLQDLVADNSPLIKLLKEPV